jgi:RNA polymerase sigma factor (sigma-70 family)
MSLADETHLNQWIHAHDGEAFRAIVETYGGMVFASARRILGNRGDAEDLTQECFAALAGSRQAPATPLGPWLHRVVTNRALNRLKSDRARSARESRFAESAPQAVEPAWSDLERILDEAIAELPDHLRGPIVSHYLLGKSQAAIAEEMGISRPAISGRIAKAIEGLRASLQRRGVSIAGALLAELLTSNASEAMPPALFAILGKTAIAAACGATRGSAIAAPVVKKGVASRILSSKAMVVGSTIAVFFVTISLWIVSVQNSPHSDSRSASASVPVVTPSENSIADSAHVASAVPKPATTHGISVSDIAEPPISGIWVVRSYTQKVNPGGPEAQEILGAGEFPQYRIRTSGNAVYLVALKPWDSHHGVFSFRGSRKGHTVAILPTDKVYEFTLEGEFNEVWSQLVCDGTYAPAPAVTASGEVLPHGYTYDFHLELERISEFNITPELAMLDTIEDRRNGAQSLAKALVLHAKEHEGQFPASLKVLVPDYLFDPTLLEAANGQSVRYTGGKLPGAIISEGTQWSDFNPTEPMESRIARWETYQQERWGGVSPMLSPMLIIEYKNPYLQFAIDMAGNVLERDYSATTPDIEDVQEIRNRSAKNLKQLGRAVMKFSEEHDQYLPGGWLSIFPEYLATRDCLIHAADPLGTLSYEIVLPNKRVVDIMENLAANDAAAQVTREGRSIEEQYLPRIPVVAEAREYGVQKPGRWVSYADGHLQFLSADRFAELCESFGIENERP